ncbi:NADP-dependent oxidoreductase [Massilia sp. TN1-12]|uniref:NADP-dependent oxidoreductase n=1 Tax=Massilia paldalensis TaxID=3377675 RepID=UPI00384DD64C
MKAFVIDRYGQDVPGRLADIAQPEPGQDEVLVRVHAASVNVLDNRIRSGAFKKILPYPLPLVLGNDCAGTVVAAGARAQRFQPGAEVYARLDPKRIGAFAEYAVVRQDALARKPANLDMREAAALPLVGLTAWQALVEIAGLQAGQRVLIHAGSGGVGTIAIQLAKYLGAFVATTTGTDNVGWVKELGADVVIDYRKEDFTTQLEGYDVVLNSQDKDVLEKSLQVLKPGGHLVSISGPPTPAFAAEQGLSWPMRLGVRLMSRRIRARAKRRGVHYSFLFMHPDGLQLDKLAALAELGAIRPVIDRTFPLAQAADALAYVERGRTKGKVVITVD